GSGPGWRLQRCGRFAPAICSPCAARKCTGTDRAPFAPQDNSALSSTKRAHASGLPTHAEEQHPPWNVVTIDQVILGVERIFQARTEIQVLVVLVAREKVRRAVTRLVQRRPAVDVGVAAFAAEAPLCPQAPRAEASMR